MKEKIPDSVGYFKNASRLNKKFISAFLAVSLLVTVLWSPAVSAAVPDVTISVDTAVDAGVSGLDLGVTYTHFMWEDGNTTAVHNAKLLLGDTIKYQNQHIMGWGADNIWPDPNGPINWSSLDSRVELMRSMGADMVLTFCSAPGWMKTKGVDWNMDDRVADAYVQDYAKLCAQIAARYPDVKYFQVWNEFKGYWDDSFKYQSDNQGGWNYQKYTDFYNAVYDAVKAVRPDAAIGGFYLPLSGDGAGSILGQYSSGTNMPLSDHDKESLDYWLANKHGADFISVDRWLVAWQDNYTGYTSEQILSLTEAYQKAIEDIRLKTDLPVWFSEYYTVSPSGAYAASFNGQQAEAAAMASTYYHMIKGAVGSDVTALLWNPMEGEVCDYLFTDTGSIVGAQPSPHYNVYKGMHDYFGRGTPLIQAVSSDPKIEVLASAQKVMIINKYNSAKTFSLNGGAVDTLQPFEVKFVDTPNNMIQNSGFEDDLTGWSITDSSTGHIATDSIHSGQKSVNFWFPAAGTNTLDYSISNCAAGSYTAEMWVRCGGTFTASFEVYQGTTLLKSTPIASNDAWTKYTLANFTVSAVSDVHIRIALNTGANVWLYFDDFSMVPSDPFVLQPVNITTDAGTAPALPPAVDAVYGDGSHVSLSVAWNSIPPFKYAEAGSFKVYGKVDGAIEKAIANINVVPVQGAPFIVTGEGKLDRTAGIKATVNVRRDARTLDHEGSEVVIFELMEGNKTVSVVALEKDITLEEKFTAFFYVHNADKAKYKVKVFISDKFSIETDSTTSLANVIILN